MNRNHLRIMDRRFQATDYNRQNIQKLADALEGRLLVLELGVGFGNLAQRLLDSDPNMAYYGIDINPESLLYTKEKLGENAKRAHLEKMDARNLQYPEAMFDAVACNTNLGEIGDLEKTFTSVYKALKPCGCFMFAFSLGKALDRFINELIQAIQSGKLQEPSEDTQYLLENPLEVSCVGFTVKEVSENLQRTGFSSAVVRNYYYNSCQLYLAEKEK